MNINKNQPFLNILFKKYLGRTLMNNGNSYEDDIKLLENLKGVFSDEVMKKFTHLEKCLEMTQHVEEGPT